MEALRVPLVVGVLVSGAGMTPARAQDGGTLTSTLALQDPENDEKRFALAVTELLTLEVSVWGVSKWLRGEHWADVTPELWWRNISEGWEYDGDGFQTNYFGHPYHGALFFNAARSNGFDFWESAGYALAGSALWEYFGEIYRPAFNDWILSGISGANLGEALYRLSALATDNTATGQERVWREIAGALINPVRGFTRLVTGEIAEVAPNPDEHSPARFQPVLQIGASSLDADGRADVEVPVQQLLLELDLAYGDPFSARLEPPFSSFRLGASFALFSRADVPAKTVARIESEGDLISWTIRSDRRSKHRLAMLLVYSYLNNPAFEFGQTSIAAQWDAEYHLSDDVSVVPSLSTSFVLMGATPNDYFEAPDGRTYDLGPGFAVAASAALQYRRETVLRSVYISGWIWPMSLPDTSSHHLHFTGVEGRYPLSPVIALGAAFTMYWRESSYREQPHVIAKNPMVKVFLAISP